MDPQLHHPSLNNALDIRGFAGSESSAEPEHAPLGFAGGSDDDSDPQEDAFMASILAGPSNATDETLSDDAGMDVDDSGRQEVDQQDDEAVKPEQPAAQAARKSASQANKVDISLSSDDSSSDDSSRESDMVVEGETEDSEGDCQIVEDLSSHYNYDSYDDDSDDDDGPFGPPTAAAYRVAGGGATHTARPRTAGNLPTSPSKSKHERVTPAQLDQYSERMPLPEVPIPFDILNHAPSRHPGPAPKWRHSRGLTSQEKIDVTLREKKRDERVKAQTKLREGTEKPWEWEWEMTAAVQGCTEDRKGKGKERATATEESDLHDAKFFPFSHHDGLEYMQGVFAVCGGDEVRILRVLPSSSSTSQAYETLATARSPINEPVGSKDAEEYFTLAWSVNLSTRPYTPILAVAGRGRVIEVFLFARGKTGRWTLHHDRTISGHGGPIYTLTFHPLRPHLLASGSHDHTLRFNDVTLPWGSNKVVLEMVKQSVSNLEQQLRGMRMGAGRGSGGTGTPMVRRRKVVGELLAVAAQEGHSEAVLSADFHPTLPLLVTCGMDARILIWPLPPSLLSATPTFPTSGSSSPFSHPSSPPPPSRRPVPSLSPPLFSSLSIHPGQWPSSVAFASPAHALIISSAPVTHHDATLAPRKCVKLWSADFLDVAPSREAEEGRRRWEREVAEFETAKRQGAGGGAAGADRGPRRFPTFTQEDGLKWRSDSGFRVKYEVVLEGQHCIGDKIGYYRPLSSMEAGDDGVQEPLIAVPTVLTAGGSENGDGLYFFRPFTAPPLPPSSSRAGNSSQHASARLGRSASHISTSNSNSRSSTPLLSQLKSDGTPVPPSSTSSNPSSHPPSHLASHDRRKKLASALFPPDRDRLAHDFHPRLLPSFVAPLPLLRSYAGVEEEERARMERVQGETRERPHLRAVAIQPGRGGAEWVVGVGEGGRMVLWRRVRRDGDGGKGKAKKEELGK